MRLIPPKVRTWIRSWNSGSGGPRQRAIRQPIKGSGVHLKLCDRDSYPSEDLSLLLCMDGGQLVYVEWEEAAMMAIQTRMRSAFDVQRMPWKSPHS